MSGCKWALALTLIALIVVMFLWWQQVKLGIVMQKPPVDWIPPGSAASASIPRYAALPSSTSMQGGKAHKLRQQRQQQQWNPSRTFVRSVNAQALLWLQQHNAVEKAEPPNSGNEIKCPLHDLLRQWGSHQSTAIAKSAPHLVGALDNLHLQMEKIGRGQTLLTPFKRQTLSFHATDAIDATTDAVCPWNFFWLRSQDTASVTVFQQAVGGSKASGVPLTSPTSSSTLVELLLTVPSLHRSDADPSLTETARAFVASPGHSRNWAITDRRTGIVWFVGRMHAAGTSV
jgi:hypothetical protein